MINAIELYDQVRTEAITNNGLVLDATGEQAMKDIFDATLGVYSDYSVFDNADVRTFINGQIRRIVTAARRDAGSGPITPELLHRSARHVMLRTRLVLNEAMERAGVELTIGPKSMAASFCLAYVLNAPGTTVNPSQSP